MSLSLNLSYRVFTEGNGWNWEVISRNRDVLVHGIADTEFKARIAAVKAGLLERLPIRLNMPRIGLMNGTSHRAISKK